jgi:hypothetical protein
MALPSFSPIELQVVISIIAVLIIFGSFLALLFSAVFGVGLVRLLYVGGRWCVGKIHHSHPVVGALPIVPHHSH